MDDSHDGQREQPHLPAPFPHQETDATPDHKDGAHSGTHSAIQWRKKEEEEQGKRMDSAPSIRSFMSASVLVQDKAGEDEVHTRSPVITLITLIPGIIY